MPKGMPKIIVDAERNRRTLEKLANQLPWFEGGAGSKTTKRVSKTTPMVRKRHQIGTPNRCEIELAPRRRSGIVSGSPKRLRIKLKGVLLGSVWGPVFQTIGKIPSERAFNNQCKKIKNF